MAPNFSLPCATRYGVWWKGGRRGEARGVSRGWLALRRVVGAAADTLTVGGALIRPRPYLWKRPGAAGMATLARRDTGTIDPCNQPAYTRGGRRDAADTGSEAGGEERSAA